MMIISYTRYQCLVKLNNLKKITLNLKALGNVMITNMVWLECIYVLLQ